MRSATTSLAKTMIPSRVFSSATRGKMATNGAKRDAADIAGVKAAEFARHWGHPEVAELLGHPSPWAATKTSANRPPPFNAEGTEEPENPRWMREL